MKSSVSFAIVPLFDIPDTFAPGGMLARESDIGKPIIVYMVNPFADPTALPLLCNSYIKMLAAYASKAGYHTYSYVYDILLKVIPITMIASKTTIPIQTPQVYAQIARETYERCSIQTSEQLGSPTCFSSIFQLARTVPKSVNFGLTSDPPKILVGEDSSYHVAYSWCFDLQWLSVLLIDTQGNLCWKASYCLGVCPSDVTFQETAKDVWDRILDTVSTRISSPRLVLVKDQAMKPIELKSELLIAFKRSDANSCSMDQPSSDGKFNSDQSHSCYRGLCPSLILHRLAYNEFATDKRRDQLYNPCHHTIDQLL